MLRRFSTMVGNAAFQMRKTSLEDSRHDDTVSSMQGLWPAVVPAGCAAAKTAAPSIARSSAITKWQALRMYILKDTLLQPL